MLTLDLLAKAGTVIATFFLGIVYTYQISQKDDVNPTITTWGVFLTASGINFLMYLFTAPAEISSNILNIADFVAITAIAIVTILYSEEGMNFQRHHIWYIIGVVVTLAFWLVTDDAFTSSILMNVVMLIGYIPTIETLHRKKENVESYYAWIPACVAGMLGAVVALESMDVLALIYAGRTVVMTGAVVAKMIQYDYFYTESGYRPV